MPTVFKKNGFRFFFYSNEGGEPIHIHVDYGGGRAKFWLVPVISLASSIGFSASDIRRSKKIIEENRDVIERAWNEFEKRK